MEKTTRPAAPTTPRCGRCTRPLTSRASIRRGYGPGCWARVRHTPADDYRAHQADSAREAVEDGAVLPVRDRIHAVVSADGAHVHHATTDHCSCPAGVRGARCWHTLAVRMLTGAPVMTRPVRVFDLAA